MSTLSEPPPPAPLASPPTASRISPPPPPPLPLLSNCTPAAPVRKIFTQDDISPFTQSEPFAYIDAFVQRLAYAVDGKRVEEECHQSEAVTRLCDGLEEMTAWVDQIELDPNPQRFGNKAFRDWYAKFAPALQLVILSSPAQAQAHTPELTHHFLTSWGSPARLDYGTGHELSFLAYVLILRLLGVLSQEDEQAIVTRVFVKYFELVRCLQKRFRLEPAGSKGVWGLDDHQHLSYLWGASQLRTHPTLRPASILRPAQISPHGVSYLFLSSILHLNALKTGPFHEHSPLLHNIATTVPSWGKVQSGLFKMYRVEVLQKVPVVQHFWFGGVLGWRKAGTGEELPSSGDGLPEEDVGEKEGRGSPDEPLGRVDVENVVAPWKLPSLSGTSLPPTGHAAGARLTSTTTFSGPTSRASGSGANLPFTRQGVMPATAYAGATTPSPTTAPKPFVPPALFANRRRRSSLSQEIGVSSSEQPVGSGNGRTAGEGRKTVAMQGGAAAASSPFGILTSATAGMAWGEKAQLETRVPWAKDS